MGDSRYAPDSAAERCFESLNLSPTEKNQKVAAKLRKEICDYVAREVELNSRAFAALERQRTETATESMLMSGVNPAWAANQLGHSVQMFLNTYARWIREADKGRELSKLELILNQKTLELNSGFDLQSQSETKKCAEDVPKIKKPLKSGFFKKNKLGRGLPSYGLYALLLKTLLGFLFLSYCKCYCINAP